ncbi:MAG: DUF2269 domain-containing protein [Actinobacteria bacterium]|nr:DUF2269 domain-containing protein [Actinomycetota bacterium]
MGVNSTLYNLVFVLHLVAVVVGFGSMFLNGAYDAQAKRRPGAGGLAIAEATLAVTKLAQYAMYAVFVFGIVLVVLSDGVWEFSQLWISLSFLLYFVAIGLLHGLVFPSARRMNALAGELVAAAASGGGRPPEVAQIEALEKRVALGGMTVNLITVIVIALMVFKPGA